MEKSKVRKVCVNKATHDRLKAIALITEKSVDEVANEATAGLLKECKAGPA